MEAYSTSYSSFCVVVSGHLLLLFAFHNEKQKQCRSDYAIAWIERRQLDLDTIPNNAARGEKV